MNSLNKFNTANSGSQLLTRRKIVHGRAGIDNVGIFGLITHFAPFDTVRNDGVE